MLKVLPMENARGIGPDVRICRLVLITLLALNAPLSSADLSGRVINGTSNKPAAGDEIVLLSEAGTGKLASTKTDAAGRFRFTVDDHIRIRFVRAIHQSVAYDVQADSMTSPLTIQVYDTADSLDGVTAVMDVQRFEATNDTLEIKQLVTIRNSSHPPRTLLTERSFEIQLPPQARVRSGLVQIENGQPIKDTASPGEQRGAYYFRQPLRPGDTRFAVVYQVPYSGKTLIEPKIRNASERFVVMLPKSMKFEPQTAGVFESMADVSSDNVQGTAPVTPEQTLAFIVSGTGMLEELRGRRAQRNGDGQQKVLSSELMHMVEHQGSVPKSPGMTKTAHNQDALVLVGLTGLFAAGTASVYFARRRTATSVVVRRKDPRIVSQKRAYVGANGSKRHVRA